MKKNNKFSAKATIQFFSVFILMISGLVACNYNKKLDLVITPTLNITGYLEENKGTFSDLLDLMDRSVAISGGKTIKYSSFLAAYGTYTMFAPTNDALMAYIHDKKGSTATTADLTDAEVRDLLNFHVLQDTISTTNFTDGKLVVPTMYGQYLITGSVFDGGATHIRINKQANIITKDIKLGNGVLHVIDGVLQPALYTTATMIENDPRFSIFTQALKATGYYDTLNVTFDPQAANKPWHSLIATTDSTYQSNGINNYTDLKNKYCNTNDPTSIVDSLHLYVAYHILSGLKFVADLVGGNAYNTVAPNQVVSISKSADTVVINEFTINGILEKGARMLRYMSDNSSSNGVWHLLRDDYYIKIRKPAAVFMDVCNFSALRSIGPTWGSASVTTNYIASGQVPEITYSSLYANQVSYVTESGNYAATRTYVNHNYLQVYFRSAAAVKWLKITTPFIAAGKYKVWFCYAEGGSGKIINLQATVATNATDSTDLPVVVNTADYLPVPRGTYTLEDWDNTLLGVGAKRYMQLSGSKNYASKNLVGRYLGAVTFTTNSTHWIKLTTLSTGASSINTWIDMIQFIPFDEDQVWPKFDIDGTAWPRPPSPYNDATPIY